VSANANNITTTPSISVVVIGRNEGQRLARCLESVRRMPGLRNTELIYVDSNSKDGSPELAACYGARVIVLDAPRTTAALGRNAGWRAANGEFILFLDGDTILHPNFANAALAPMLQDPSVVAVWGHRREIHPEASIYNRILDLDWVYAPGIAEFCGGDVLMRRRAIEEAGGYDAELIAGEEPELCRRMRARGYRILHIDHPMTGHDLQITRWSQYWKHAARAGHAFAEISARFRNSEDRFWHAERKRNLVRGTFWMASLAIALILSAVAFTVLPFLIWLALLLIMSLRSAWKSRWKSRHVPTLLLYGVHSHLQQIPICVGQIRYTLDQRRGNRRALIEYKEPDRAQAK
jgi:cellulose synthase/poly-beta-1,6-N-acetylglucosamine synthase-like glycosyltransferase